MMKDPSRWRDRSTVDYILMAILLPAKLITNLKQTQSSCRLMMCLNVDHSSQGIQGKVSRASTLPVILSISSSHWVKAHSDVQAAKHGLLSHSDPSPVKSSNTPNICCCPSLSKKLPQLIYKLLCGRVFGGWKGGKWCVVENWESIWWVIMGWELVGENWKSVWWVIMGRVLVGENEYSNIEGAGQ